MSICFIVHRLFRILRIDRHANINFFILKEFDSMWQCAAATALISKNGAKTHPAKKLAMRVEQHELYG